MDQAVPFQCSTNVWTALTPVYWPTAQTSLAPTAATPQSWLLPPIPLGLDTMRHPKPQVIVAVGVWVGPGVPVGTGVPVGVGEPPVLQPGPETSPVTIRL